MRILNKTIGCGLLLLSFAASGQALADGNASANLNVKLEITKGCSISAGDGGVIDLGKHTNMLEDATGHGTLELKCTKGGDVNYTIAMSAGGNAGGDYKSRKLKNETGKLIEYNIYRDSGYTQIWGDTTDVFEKTYDDSKTPNVIDVYVKAPAKPEGVFPGTYTDTVVAQITWK